MNSPRAWVGVVSQSHVARGVQGGFAQVCHGRRAPLARLKQGDWLVYYSPSTTMEGGAPLKAFTALGRMRDDRVYPFDMGGGFVPFRRDVDYLPVARVAPVDALKPSLAFIRATPNWGMLARRGIFEIPLEDLGLIARGLGIAGVLAGQ